jgi:hypothetical protein
MEITGQIVKIKSLEYTHENLPTGILNIKNNFCNLCSTINVKLYPARESLYFSNESIEINSLGLVLSNVGRPYSFQAGEMWEDYDLMRILIEGKLYECFRFSLQVMTL